MNHEASVLEKAFSKHKTATTTTNNGNNIPRVVPQVVFGEGSVCADLIPTLRGRRTSNYRSWKNIF